MYCPETIRLNKEHLMIIHYASSDFITWERVPKMEKLNIFRYGIIINPKGWDKNNKPIYINKDGLLAVRFSRLIYRVKKKLGLE